MASITCTKLSLYTIGAVALQIAGLSIFVFGFFPVKPSLSGFSGPESFQPLGFQTVDNLFQTGLAPDQLRSMYRGLSEIPPLFERLILMVIDGLPAEFVLGKDGQPPGKTVMEAMPYTQSLLANGMAIGYHAKAAAPTVTMPRLKAMVSGAIGGYLDVAFNFNTQAFLGDNLLDQLFKIGWKMVMLGDETWLKLFPKLFMRHDGVSSFYVKDTVQVDQNVTRHLGYELRRDDWNLLILHYLGLDHVGHVGGRKSALMAPKLAEMDEVVKKIHSNAIQEKMNNGGGRTLLVVVSDHGMTENGNHGGFSYEETDSLALFVGLNNRRLDHALATQNTIYQVDIAPTLALLFGVPIPKNNVGVLISEAFEYLADDDKLRALELNAWQLLKLLQAQLPGLSCKDAPLKVCNNVQVSRTIGCEGEGVEKMLCCLYLNAAVHHSSWKFKNSSRSITLEDYSGAAAAYFEFMRSASEWLSRSATDKPAELLAFGVAALALACLILLILVLHLVRDASIAEKHVQNITHSWCLDDFIILAGVLILVISMGSSSMVEEEQYIWHFVTATFYMILLRKTLKPFPVGDMRDIRSLLKWQNQRTGVQICSVVVLLVSRRILRGWHQGGVNWIHLPDIAKLLGQAGSGVIGLVQLASGVLITCLGLLALALIVSKTKVIQLVGFGILISGSLVLLHVMNFQQIKFSSSTDNATLSAQMIYVILGIITFGSAMSIPWAIPVSISDTYSKQNTEISASVLVKIQVKYPLLEFRDCSYLIGLVYLVCWCLLQILLQQPVNSTVIFLLLMQILVSMIYFSYSWQRQEWVEVAALYCLGMAGHFALGNSNTLATIDVAGAFNGLSSHSTLLSGILMFVITHASPMCGVLSLVMYTSVKKTEEIGDGGKKMLGIVCLVPLGLNSIFLAVYTVVLLVMRNHLFVWSVFSPKYLYVCTMTMCIYVGVFVVAATEIYILVVLGKRRKKQWN